MNKKRQRGQFFTITNPFKTNIFFEWYNNIPNIEDKIILEPFAGANNIVAMIEGLNIEQPKGWKCFDIDNSYNNVCEEYPVELRDVIADFPKEYDIIITNPPYLSKSSASRRKLDFPDTIYDDVYKECLNLMLKNSGYIAAIIPDSFITSGLFLDRLYAYISLNVQMFNDTECPVGLALFVPYEVEDTKIYRMDEYVGTMNELKDVLNIFSIQSKEEEEIYKRWKFNDPNGDISVKLVDNQEKESIFFMRGDKIASEDIKVSSRAFTRISGVTLDQEEIDRLIETCNKNIEKYRLHTKDVFMTSFKGLRKDGRYRRRLDFKSARIILTKSYLEMKNESRLQ